MHLWPYELGNGRSTAPVPYDNYLFALAWLDEKSARIQIANEEAKHHG